MNIYVVSTTITGTVCAVIAQAFCGPKADLTVKPFQLELSLNPSSILGAGSGQIGSGTVTLDAPLRAASNVTVYSNYLSPTYINAPIAAGQTAGTFNFQGGAVSQPTTGDVTATLGVSTTTQITVEPVGEPYLPCDQCEAQAHKPVNLINGNVWITQQDYQLPGLGGGIQLERTWNSLWRQNNGSLSVNGMFGDSWRSTYEERVVTISSTAKQYFRANGDSWWFSWNPSANAYLVAQPQNQHASLTFDTSTTLYTLTFADGTKHIFNNSGYLIALVDRNGNQTNVTYDVYNRIMAVTDAASRSLTFVYGAGGLQPTSAQDATGTVATYAYNGSQLTSVTYADGSQLNFSYNNTSDNLITAVTDSQGKLLESHTYDDSTHRRGITSASAAGVDSVSVSFGSTSTQLTDSLGNMTTYNLGFGGAVRFVTSVSGTTCNSCGASQPGSFGFDANANRTSSTDASGNVTNFTYDANGNMTSRSTTLADGSIQTWSYTYNSFGEVATATDPLNHVTTNTYDTHGNLLTVTTPAPDGNTAASTTTFTYNANGTLATIKDPLNHTTTLTYYPTGLINTITDANSQVTTYAYDARGNRTSVIDPVNGSAHPTTFNYDSRNRLTKMTYPDATFVQFHYDTRGRRDYIIDQNNKQTTYAYDDADRLVSMTDAQTPSAGVTQYTYDTESNLKTITDALGHQTSFTYDPQRRLTLTTFPSTLTEAYGYDSNGNVTTKTDRNSQTIQYTYDTLNRLTRKSYPDTSQVNYTYDLANRLTQVSDSSGTYTFGYDNMNRLTSAGVDYSFDTAGNLTVQYAYDAASNRTSMTDPQNLSTSYGYDTLNRLSSLNFNNQSTPFAFSYDNLSRRTQLTRPNGVTTNYTYDTVSRLLSVLHQLGSTTIDGASYTYDNAGNRLSKTNQRAGVTSNYTYDPIYQLTQVTQAGSTTETYSYDKVGNRLSSLGVSPYSYNSSNELTSTPSMTYTYDNNGNTKTKSDGTQYTWDFENRLTRVVLPGTGGTVNFRYDPFGRRVQKSFTQGTTTTTTIYLYDETNLLEEVDNSGIVLARYTPGPRIDQPLAELRAGVSSSYEQDALGSTTSLSSSVGVLANTYTYDSFGKVTTSTGTVTNTAQYTGREFDSETGAYFYRARYYDQNVGRYLSEDPIKFRGGINFYPYVNNRPTKYKDPSGLLRDCDEEHIECNRRCQNAPVGCLPWPVGRYGSPAVRRWSRTAYCTAKCLEEYMACNAANEATQLTEYCSSNPVGCAALVTASVIIVAQPELGPVLVPVF